MLLTCKRECQGEQNATLLKGFVGMKQIQFASLEKGAERIEDYKENVIHHIFIVLGLQLMREAGFR